MWETTVMHKQVSGCTVNFGPNFPESPFLESQTRKPPCPPPPHFGKLQIWDDQSLLQNTPPFQKTSDLGWPKFTPEYPPSPHFRKLQIWDDQSLLQNTPPPHFGKLQIWDDQSLLRNTPPPRVSECWELQHVETLSNPDNYSFKYCIRPNGDRYVPQVGENMQTMKQFDKDLPVNFSTASDDLSVVSHLLPWIPELLSLPSK